MLNLKCKAGLSQIGLSLGENGAVQQCRKKISSTVPKMKTLVNSAENMNKFQDIKCGNQKLNGEPL